MDQERDDYDDFVTPMTPTTRPNDFWPRVVGVVILIGLVWMVAACGLSRWAMSRAP